MLNPNNDRLDYGKILTPPDGYALDFAVGTTYSLNLDALVGVCLALGLSEETDSELMNNPVCLLEALRNTGDKLVLFCEGGQIHMPKKTSELYILLEKIVFTVKTAKRKGIASFPSFHPKFWLIRYINQSDEYLYRIIILSRNLTFDRNWDVTFYMDGEISVELTEKNEPVCDFLRFLSKQIKSDYKSKDKIIKINELINDLSFVNFVPYEKEFIDYEFIPNGIKDMDGNDYCFDQTSLFKDTYRELLIMSPFISSGIIKGFNNRNDKSTIEGFKSRLFTRTISLAKLKPEDVSNFDIFVLRDGVVGGETSISEDTTDAMGQDIHAKLYMTRKYSTSELYLGSLNASHNAVYGNVEFMIHLTAKNRYLNLEKLCESLFCGSEDGPNNPFMKVDLSYADSADNEEEYNDLNAIIKEINRSNSRASVHQDGEYYSLKINFGACDIKNCNVEVNPLLYRKKEKYKDVIAFDKLSLTQLSEFYVVSVSKGDRTVERVLIIPTDGLPRDRENVVVSNVIKDTECFYRYIAFLLGDDSVVSMLEAEASNAIRSKNDTISLKASPALYEKMLLVASSNPEKFKGIEYLMKMVSEDDVIPEDFRKLYLTFKKALKLDA